MERPDSYIYRSNNAFSLIEVLAVLVFFSITLLGLARLLFPVLDSIERVKQSTQARFWVNPIWSTLQSKGFEKTYDAVSKGKQLLLSIDEEGNIVERGIIVDSFSSSKWFVEEERKLTYFVFIQAASFYRQQNDEGVFLTGKALPEDHLNYPEAYLHLRVRIYTYHSIHLEKLLPAALGVPQWDTFITLNR